MIGYWTSEGTAWNSVVQREALVIWFNMQACLLKKLFFSLLICVFLNVLSFCMMFLWHRIPTVYLLL